MKSMLNRIKVFFMPIYTFTNALKPKEVFTKKIVALSQFLFWWICLSHGKKVLSISYMKRTFS